MKKRNARNWSGWMRRALLVLSLVVAVAACTTTTEQTKKITEPPALPGGTTSPLPQLPPPAASDPKAATADANSAKRIDEFIAAHPELTPSTIASLRIRQAVIYLDQKQYNLAVAAFDSADATQLSTARDRALKEVSSDLVWWYRTAPLDNIPGAEMGRAQAVRESLKVQIAKRQDSPDVRDLLAEMRAWVGLKYFWALPSRGKQKAVLEDTVNEYATIFTQADLAYLCTPSRAAGDVSAEDQRRRLRAGPVISQAAKAAAELTGSSKPTFREPLMQDLIAPTSPSPQCTGK
ncbi:MAG: hypothetical protein ABW205_09805 [Burkholderiales bacterium]